MACVAPIGITADMERVLCSAPNVERCYERLHRKVQPDCYMLAAKGQPGLLWFTLVGGRETCFLGSWGRGRGRGCNWRPIWASYSSRLCAGTLIRGTVVACSANRVFACEDLLRYRGKDVGRATLTDKMPLLATLFRVDFARTQPPPPFIITKLPVWAASRAEADALVPTLPYSLYRVRAFSSLTRGLQEIQDAGQPSAIRQLVLDVRARQVNDVYDLVCADGGVVGTAAVPSYARSVALNRIFRNVRENENLDLLEESEDEEIFQSVGPGRYVDLQKCVRMVCTRVPRYPRLEPVRAAAPDASLSSRSQCEAALSRVGGRPPRAARRGGPSRGAA